MAVSAALLVSPLFRTDYGLLLRASAAVPYVPVAPLCWLFAHAPPAMAVVNVFRITAVASTSMALIGFLSAPMLGVSFVSSWVLASLLYSFSGGNWSHEYNGILLVELALLFAPSGRICSVDAMLGMGRGGRRLTTLACNAPVVVAQFMVAWMFFNAFVYKALIGGIQWIRSDNLRNILAFQWLGVGRLPSLLVVTISSHVWLYRGAALASMTAQCAVIFSVVFFCWPYRRALFGLGFVLEALGLGFMMSRWDISPFNPHWLLLYGVFVDWNFLFPVPRVQQGLDVAAEHEVPASRMSAALVWVWPASLVLVECVVSFASRGRTTPPTYPFTEYAMYAQLFGNVLTPSHFDFEFLGPRFTSPDVDLAIGTPAARLVYTGDFRVTEEPDLAVVRGRLLQIQTSLGVAHPEMTKGVPMSLTVFQTVYHVPPYPGAVVTTVATESIRGVLNRWGEFMGVSASIARGDSGNAVIRIDARNVDIGPDTRVLAVPVDFRRLKIWGGTRSASIYGVGPPVALRGTWDGAGFHTGDLPHGSYLIQLRARPHPGFGVNPNEALLFSGGPLVER